MLRHASCGSRCVSSTDATVGPGNSMSFADAWSVVGMQAAAPYVLLLHAEHHRFQPPYKKAWCKDSAHPDPCTAPLPGAPTTHLGHTPCLQGTAKEDTSNFAIREIKAISLYELPKDKGGTKVGAGQGGTACACVRPSHGVLPLAQCSTGNQCRRCGDACAAAGCNAAHAALPTRPAGRDQARWCSPDGGVCAEGGWSGAGCGIASQCYTCVPAALALQPLQHWP